MRSGCTINPEALFWPRTTLESIGEVIVKIYHMADQEGTSGVTDFENIDLDTIENWFKRRRIQDLETAEVKAAVEGALKAGAECIVVNDAHHRHGYTILIEELPEEVQVIHGDQRWRPFWMPCLDDTYDAMIMTGRHPMAGTVDGILPHTRYEINGLTVGEVGMSMILAGNYGIPSVFISGDRRAVEEAQALCSNIEAAAVKTALNKNCVITQTPIKARAMIREGVERGIGRRLEIEPVRLEPPYKMRTAKCPDQVFEGDDLIEVAKLCMECGTDRKFGARLKQVRYGYEVSEEN
jgi:D-amino peptidase